MSYSAATASAVGGFFGGGVSRHRVSLWGLSADLDRFVCGIMKLQHFAADLRISHRLAGYQAMLACASMAHLLMLLGRAACAIAVLLGVLHGWSAMNACSWLQFKFSIMDG